MNRFTLKKYIKPLGAGLISTVGFAPINFAPLPILCLGWLFYKIEVTESIKSSLKLAFAFFFALHLGTLYWIVNPLLINARAHAFLIPFAVTIIPGYLSALLVVAVFLTKKYAKDTFDALLIFSISLCLIMYLYGNYCPGFPWVYYGYIWTFHEIFLQSLSIYGIHGLNFITVIISCLLGASYLFFRKHDMKKTKISFGVALILFCSLASFGFFRLYSNTTEFTNYKARIIQCNISQSEKMNRNYAYKNLQKHLQLSQHSTNLNFIIWPEACVPYLYRSNFTQLNDFLRSSLKDKEILITGAVREDLSTNKIYNSAVIIDHNGNNITNYDKIRLVPFGEYIPLRWLLPFRGIASEIEDFDIGSSQKSININGLKICMTICYEIVFPTGWITKQRPDLIINLTNDAWFGFSSQPFQHLQISRARAIERGLPLIRATNYGISAVFDAYGRELHNISINTSDAIDFFIPKSIKQTYYDKLEDLIFFIILILCGACIYLNRKTPQNYTN